MNSGDSQAVAVKTGYVLGIILCVVFIAAVALAAYVAAMLLALNVDLGDSYGAMGSAVKAATHNLTRMIIPVALFCALVVGLGCAWVAIRSSHKVAGPVYRLSADLRRMAAGDYDFTVATRERDQMKDLAAALENARATTHRRQAALKLVLRSEINVVLC